jgi:hypothetical protein
VNTTPKVFANASPGLRQQHAFDQTSIDEFGRRSKFPELRAIVGVAMARSKESTLKEQSHFPVII